MKCPECGKDVDDNVFTCPSCGFDISLYKSAYNRILKEKQEQNNNISSSHTSDNITSKSQNNSKIGIIVGIVLVCIIGFFFINSQKSSSVSSYDSHYTYNSYTYDDYKRDWEYNKALEERKKLSDARSNLRVTVNKVVTDSAATYANCTIKNIGNTTYRFVKVKGSFMDSSGDVILTGDTYAAGSEGLAPNESTDFRLSASGTNNKAKTCEVTIYDCD